MLKKLAAMLGSSDSGATQRREEQLSLATCVLLLEAACIDNEFTEAERAHIARVMQERFDLTPGEADEVISEARAARNESHDLFRFTTRLNQEFSTTEKVQVLEEVWRIIYSDGTLNAHEDHLAHKLRNLLNLNHPQMIEAKMKVLDEIRGGR